MPSGRAFGSAHESLGPWQAGTPTRSVSEEAGCSLADASGWWDDSVLSLTRLFVREPLNLAPLPGVCVFPEDLGRGELGVRRVLRRVEGQRRRGGGRRQRLRGLGADVLRLRQGDGGRGGRLRGR